jgi:hypothetical protein
MPSWIVAAAFSLAFPAMLALMFVFTMPLLVVISALGFIHATLLPAGVEAIR